MKKIISVLLAATMTAGVLAMTACNSSKEGKKLSKNEATKVEAGSEWFDYNENEIVVDKYSLFEIKSRFLKTDEGYVAACTGTYKVDDPDTSSFITDFGYRDEDGILELNFDGSVKDYTVIAPEDVGLGSKYSSSISDICYYNGDVLCLVDGGFFDEETYNYSEKSVLYNFTKGKAEDISYITNKMADTASLDYATYTDSGYMIAVDYDYTGTSNLYIAKDGEFIGEFNLSSMVTGYDGLARCYTKGDSIVVECINSSRMYVNFIIDTNTITASVENTDIEVPTYISETWKSDYYDEDGNLVEIETDGIHKGDELICDFANTYCNPAFLKLGSIVDVSDDHYAVVIRFNNLADHKNRIFFVTFDKASSNPNAGKTILTAGFTGELELTLGTAISEFNKTNPDYYVLAKSYNVSEDDVSNDKLEVNKNLSTTAIITNQLMIDMLNGDGPDILINTANYSQFNNDKFLMDLSSFVDEEFTEGVLFDNVIEASKTNGKLYQLPTTFAVNGIIMDAKNANGKVGFTFDEFGSYVSDACNGNNPLAPAGGRIEAFDSIYYPMAELMYDDKGNVDMKNGVFEQIASYCMDNIGEKQTGFVAPSNGMESASVRLNSFVSLNCIIPYLFANPMKTDLAFTGIPSTDGRGPSIVATSSVAVSTSCCDEDGAKAFVKSLLTNEKNYEQVLENPILVSAAITTSNNLIGSYNNNYEMQLEMSTPSQLNAMGIYYYDPALIDEYIAILKTANCTVAVDMNIMVIINEEIQAYFAGQKSIDDVIDIIQNRAQTVVDEM